MELKIIERFYYYRHFPKFMKRAMYIKCMQFSEDFNRFNYKHFLPLAIKYLVFLYNNFVHSSTSITQFMLQTTLENGEMPNGEKLWKFLSIKTFLGITMKHIKPHMADVQRQLLSLFHIYPLLISNNTQ